MDDHDASARVVCGQPAGRAMLVNPDYSVGVGLMRQRRRSRARRQCRRPRHRPAARRHDGATAQEDGCALHHDLQPLSWYAFGLFRHLVLGRSNGTEITDCMPPCKAAWAHDQAHAEAGCSTQAQTRPDQRSWSPPSPSNQARRARSTQAVAAHTSSAALSPSARSPPVSARAWDTAGKAVAATRQDKRAWSAVAGNQFHYGSAVGAPHVRPNRDPPGEAGTP